MDTLVPTVFKLQKFKLSNSPTHFAFSAQPTLKASSPTFSDTVIPPEPTSSSKCTYQTLSGSSSYAVLSLWPDSYATSFPSPPPNTISSKAQVRPAKFGKPCLNWLQLSHLSKSFVSSCMFQCSWLTLHGLGAPGLCQSWG